MEFNIKYKQLSCWQEENAVGKVPISMEAVVPDSREDAARVIWTRAGVLLKGKEPNAHSCCFLGEACASVLYQTESGELAVLRLSKEFSWTAEADAGESEALPQICWRPTTVEGKLLNPRKIAVNMELRCHALSFCRSNLPTEPELPDGEGRGLQFLTAESQAVVLREVREKAFTMREQLPLQPGQRAPRSIEGEELQFLSLESERLGQRCIVKGEAELRLWGLGEDGLPAACSFRLPFSQLVETGEDEELQSVISAQTSSLYLDWREGMDGERSLDAEIHAVLQLRFYACAPCKAVTDAYSTRMASAIREERLSAIASITSLSATLKTEETPEGKLLLHAQASLAGTLTESEERRIVTALVLEEDAAWDPSKLPAISLVRRGGESLWELAKAYRSSVKAIEAYNKEGSELLLIPAL